MSPLASVLAVSIAANALLGWAWIDTRDGLAVAVRQRDDARHDASACSAATEALRELADRRAADARPALAAARTAATARQSKAQAILSTPASVPGAVRVVDVVTFGPDHGARVTVEAPPMLFLADRRVSRTVVFP